MSTYRRSIKYRGSTLALTPSSIIILSFVIVTCDFGFTSHADPVNFPVSFTDFGLADFAEATLLINTNFGTMGKVVSDAMGALKNLFLNKKNRDLIVIMHILHTFDV